MMVQSATCTYTPKKNAYTIHEAKPLLVPNSLANPKNVSKLQLEVITTSPRLQPLHFALQNMLSSHSLVRHYQ